MQEADFDEKDPNLKMSNSSYDFDEDDDDDPNQDTICLRIVKV